MSISECFWWIHVWTRWLFFQFLSIGLKNIHIYFQQLAESTHAMLSVASNYSPFEKQPLVCC